MESKWYMDVTIHAGSVLREDVSGGCKQMFTRFRLKKDIRVKLKKDLTFIYECKEYQLVDSRHP